MLDLPKPSLVTHRRLRCLSILLCLVLAATACDSGPSVEDARALVAQERYQAALEPLRLLLEENPDDPELNYLYGSALNRSASSRLAVWSLRKAAEDPAWALRANQELAAAQIAAGNWPEAIEAASAALEEQPEDVQSLSLRGTAYLGDGKSPELAIEDFDIVLELEPENIAAMASRASALLLLGEVDEAEETMAQIAELTGEQDADQTRAMLCAARAVLQAEKGEKEVAKERFDACLEEFPRNPLLIEQAVSFFDSIGEPERATELLEKALEATPGSQSYRRLLSARAIAEDDLARAEAILRSGTTRPDPRTRSVAWVDLTNFFLERDDLPNAVDAYEQAMALSPDPSQRSLLQHADLLARAGRHEEALKVAEKLEQDAYRGLIEARVHLDQLRPAEALARLEDVFPTWPNNAGARYYAARAAEQMGDFERAIEEYRQSIRSGPEQTEAALRLAKLYLEAGALQNAWNHAAQYFRAHPDDPEGVRVLLRAASVADPASVQQLFTRLRGTPLWPTALAIRASMIERKQGAEAALALVEQAQAVDLTRPANAELLRTRTRLQLELGRVDAARKTIDAALAAAPDSASFHEIHGLVLEAEQKTAEARAAYERAVELDPRHALALESLGRKLQQDGELEQALALYDRAMEAAPEQSEAGRLKGLALLAAGRNAEAEVAWEARLREHPWDARTARSLAELRVADGRLDDRTLELAERAVLFRGGREAEALLLEVHRKRGEAERATAVAKAIEAGQPLPPTQITPIDGL